MTRRDPLDDEPPWPARLTGVVGPGRGLPGGPEPGQPQGPQAGVGSGQLGEQGALGVRERHRLHLRPCPYPCRERRHPFNVDTHRTVGMYDRHREERRVRQGNSRGCGRHAGTRRQPVDHRAPGVLVRHTDLDAPHVGDAAVPQPVADGVLHRDPPEQPLPRGPGMLRRQDGALVGVEVVARDKLAGGGVRPVLPGEHPAAGGPFGDGVARRPQQHRPHQLVLGEPAVGPALDARPHRAVRGAYLQIGGDGAVPDVTYPHRAGQPLPHGRVRAEEAHAAQSRGQQQPVRGEMLPRPVAEQLARGVEQRAGRARHDKLPVDAPGGDRSDRDQPLIAGAVEQPSGTVDRRPVQRCVVTRLGQGLCRRCRPRREGVGEDDRAVRVPVDAHPDRARVRARRVLPGHGRQDGRGDGHLDRRLDRQPTQGPDVGDADDDPAGHGRPRLADHHLQHGGHRDHREPVGEMRPPRRLPVETVVDDVRHRLDRQRAPRLPDVPPARRYRRPRRSGWPARRPG